MKQLPKGTDTTMFKSFSSFSDLSAKTIGHQIFIELSNGWYCHVTKKALKKTSISMARIGIDFEGSISFAGGGAKHVQVSIQEK